MLQAGAAADGALAAALADWPGRWTVDLAQGAGASRDVRTAAGPARVRALRLDATRFVLEAEARARAGALPGEEAAVRRRGLLVHLQVLTPPGSAAVTAGGPVDVAAGALVDGNASSSAECAGGAAVPGPAVAAPAVTAPPGAVAGEVRSDSAAWAPALAPRFGAVAYADLRAAVDRMATPAGPASPLPRAGGGEGPFGPAAEPCAVDAASWGEPRRGPDAVTACGGAYPVVRLRGPVARLAGPARFQGLVLADGDLEVDGLVEGAGMLVVRGAVRVDGALVLDGALVAGGAVRLGAGSRVRASPCATSRAAAYAARAGPFARRSWAEVTR
jgi:hypothetical protein